MPKRDDNVIDLRVDGESGEILAENGKSLEQIAEEMNDEAEAMTGFIHGSQKQLSLDVGGRKPTGSVVKIKGTDFPILGQFPKQKRIRFLVDVEVEDITFKTIRDSDRRIVGHDRVHIAVVDGIQADPLKAVLEICEEHEASEILMGAISEVLG